MSCEPCAVACLFIPSCPCCSRGVADRDAGASCRVCPSRLICSSRAIGRGVRSRLVVASRGRIVIDDVPVAVAWLLATLGAASRLIVSWSGEALASLLISAWG